MAMAPTIGLGDSFNDQPTWARLSYIALYVTSLLLAFAAILWLKPELTTNDLSYGIHVAALFVPYIAVGFMLAVTVLFHKLSVPVAILLVLTFVILCGAFFDVYYNPIWHYYFDDPGRYSGYAHFMLLQKTLWGGDALVGMGQNIAYYVDQPGFRYVVAAMIKSLGGEHRLFQLVAMLMYLASVLFFLASIQNSLSYARFLGISLFYICALPYAACNVLEGLSEWSAVSLVLCFTALTAKKKYSAAVICLALVPFIRQNLLLASLALFLLLVIFLVCGKSRLWLTLLYLIVLGIPVYHNLYYAGELAFFTTNRGRIVNWNAELLDIVGTILNTIVWKAGNYFGYYPTASLSRTILAILFAPVGALLVVLNLFWFSGRARLFYLIVVMLTIGPTILYGWGYFPRFVFSNLAIVISVIPLFLSLNIKSRDSVSWSTTTDSGRIN